MCDQQNTTSPFREIPSETDFQPDLAHSYTAARRSDRARSCVLQAVIQRDLGTGHFRNKGDEAVFSSAQLRFGTKGKSRLLEVGTLCRLRKNVGKLAVKLTTRSQDACDLRLLVGECRLLAPVPAASPVTEWFAHSLIVCRLCWEERRTQPLMTSKAFWTQVRSGSLACTPMSSQFQVSR